VLSDTHTITFGTDKRLGFLMSPEGDAWELQTHGETIKPFQPPVSFFCPQHSDVTFHAHLCFPRPSKEVPYLSGSLLALVGGCEDVELCAASGQRALVNVHSAQVNIDTTGSPARKKTGKGKGKR
jgi:hypothetical protein